MARLSSSEVDGESDPNLSFGIENLDCPIQPRLEADLYIEAFVLKFSPASGDATEVSAQLQAYGTVDMYFMVDTGPAITFETTNQTVSAFRQQLIEEIRILVK